MKTTMPALALMFMLSYSSSQGQVLFNRVIGNMGVDIGHCVRQTSDRGYVVVGVTNSANSAGSNIYLLKTDSMGVLQWSRSFGTLLGTDVAKKILVLDDDGLVIVGYTNAGQAGGYDILAIRTDAYGNEIWQQTYGGMGWDLGHDIVLLPNGNYGIAGITYSYGNGSADGFFLEIAPDGTQVGSQTFGTSLADGFNSLTIVDSHLYFCGFSTSENGADNNAYIVKATLSGSEVWNRVFGGDADEYLAHIIPTMDGRILAVGGTQSTVQGTWDYYYIRLTADGQTSFERNDGGAGDEEAREVTEDEYGNFALIGYTTTHGSGGRLVQLFMLGQAGWWMNSPHSHSPRDEEGFSVQRTHDGGFIMAGYTYGYNAEQSDVFIIKTDLNGSNGFDSPVELVSDEGIVSVEDEILPETGIIIRDGVLKATVDDGWTIRESLLYDLAGRRIASSGNESDCSCSSMDVSALAGGIYVLRVVLNDGRWSSLKIAINR